jgi:hypothetical protein
LTECAFLDAYGAIASKRETPAVLVATVEDAGRAQELAQRFKVDCVLLPSAILGVDAWALAGQETVYWSPGA